MITVFGAGGFIGSNIIKLLQSSNKEYYAPARDEVLIDKELGDIIYCIGLTADFRTKPFDTVEAHVCKLSYILKNCSFKSLTYLSSARVYINCKSEEVSETSVIPINPLDPDELYTLTKLTGERLCFSSGKKVKIVRLSNVFGNDQTSENFLTDVIKKVIQDKKISFNVLPESAKDYINIEDVVSLLVKIASDGKSDIYNVASGVNTSNETIITSLKELLNFKVEISSEAQLKIFPKINIDKIKREFNYTPGNMVTFIPNLINNYYNVSD